MLVKALLVLNLLLIVSDGANILSVLPSSSKSHFIYPNTLLLELAASGHKVITKCFAKREFLFILISL